MPFKQALSYCATTTTILFDLFLIKDEIFCSLSIHNQIGFSLYRNMPLTKKRALQNAIMLLIPRFFQGMLLNPTNAHFMTEFRDGIMVNPCYTTIFMRIKMQVYTTILFANSQYCNSSWHHESLHIMITLHHLSLQIIP